MRKLLFLLVLLSSCKAKQMVSQQSTNTVHDTIRDYRLDIRYNAIHDTLLIENPCDSLGILKDFYSKTTLPQGKVIIRSHKGNIQATIDIDSIAQVYESKYRSKKNELSQISTKIVTKNVIPRWAIWFMAVTSLLSFLYLRKIINTFVM